MVGKSRVFLGIVLLVVGMLAGCGGGSSSAIVQPVSVIVTTTASTVDATDSVTLTASVDNDKNSAGVTWSVSGGGVLSSQTTSSALYTAPAASSSALTVTVTATSVADTTKTASKTLTVPAAPSITTTATQLANSVGAAYNVTLAGSGGIAPYTWKATGLPACLTLSTTGVLSGTIQASCAGTTTPTFTLTDSGSATALTASQQLSLVIAAAPAISFTGSMPTSGTYNTAYSGSAAASGGVGTLTYTQSGTWPTWLSLTSSTGAVTGTPAAVGPFSFSVQAADAFGDSAIHTYPITVAQATPTISISNIPTSAAYGGSFTATISYSGDSATKSVVSNSTSVCTVSGTAVSYVGVGTCSLTASATVGTDYAAVTGSAQTFAVIQATPTISISNLPSSAVYGGSFTPTYTNSGNGTASVASNTTSICTVSGGVVSYVSAGSCSLTASTTSTTNYAAATGTAQNFTIAQATPTISINDLPSSGIYGGSFTPTFANSGNGAASVASNSTSVCTVSSGAVSYVGVGSCSLTASTAATTNYVAATGAAQSFAVAQATPTISISNLPSSGVYGGSFTPTFANSGNGAASVVSNSASVCTVSGGVVSYVGVGSCSLTASTAATTNYVAATGPTQSITVAQATPTISISNIPTSAAYGGSFTATISYSGDSTTKSVVSNSTSVCTVSGTAVSYVGVGTCSLTASATVGTDYTAVTGAAQTFSVVQATPTVSISNLPSSGIYGGSFTPTFANSGNGAASVASSSPSVCTVSSGVVSYVGAGSCYLTASTASTTDYAAATGAVQSITIAQATPTISISNLPSSGVYGGSFTPTFANSGNGAASVVSSTTAVCTVTSGVVSYVGVGNCSLTASSAATTNYVAATGPTQSITIAQATPTISISNLPSSGVYGGSFTPTFANSGNGAVSVVSNSASVCTVSSGVVSYVGVGSCSLTASTASTTNYVAATGTAQGFTVAQVALTITASSASVNYGASVPVISPSYVGFVHGDTSASLTPPPSCVTNYTVTSDPASYPTSCSGAVDGNYAISYVAGSVVVSKATPTITTPPTTSGITYGSALSVSNLTGGVASVGGTFTWTTPSTTPVAGTQTEGYTFTPTSTKDYVTVTGTVSVSVAKATSIVSAWPVASGIALGQTLASSTFSGGSTTPTGSFAWANSSITPSAGTTSYSVIFTPTDAADYTTVTGTVSVSVGKVTPTIISLPTASGITYGPTLAASTLTGGSGSVLGGFTWTTPSIVPGAGTASYSVTFTPNDTTDYNVVTGTVSLTVAQATPTISVKPSAGGITYGQTLQASTLTGGSASTAGGFAWTALSTVPAAGNPSYSVTFTPTDGVNYTTVTGMVSVAVAKATLTVTASSTTVAVGAAIPTITPSYSGYQNGDTAAVVTVTPTCSTTYATTSGVGSYPSTCLGGTVNSNYAFSYVSGSVTVVAFSITTSPTLPTGYVGSVYAPITLAVAGGTSPFNWTVSVGSLPTGLSLNAVTGVINGTPTGSTGKTTFTVQVTDSAQNSAELQFNITIVAGVAISTVSPLTPGVQGTVYAGETLSATGGTGSYSWTWAAASGSLPTGLILNKSTGAISGTPSVAGTYSIAVTATDTASNTASMTFSLTVYQPLSITSTTLPGGTANTTYTSTTLAATGGTGNYTWSWAAASNSTLPGGMTFTGGVLAGTPAAQGSYSVVITVKDTTLNVTSSTTFTLAIAYAPLSITTSTLPVGSVGTAYTSTQFAATGGSSSYTWSWAAVSGSSLPTSPSLSTSGVLSGTPSAAGSYLVQVTVTDATASLSKTATFTINIDSAGFSITTANPLPINYAGTSYGKPLAATGGSGSRTWTVSSGSLPTGMSLTTGGNITASVNTTVVGTYSFTVKVIDTGGNQAFATFSLSVVPVMAVATSSPLPTGTVGVAYSQTVTASGGSGNYSWSWAAASGSLLPAGLTINSSSGAISGTPTTAGSYSVSVTVTDTSVTGKTASASLSLPIVNPPVSINGQISLVNNCGAASVPPIAVTLSSNTTGSSFIPVTANTDSSGNYSFSNVPTDSYTIAPVVSTPSSGTVPSSVFYPAATKSVTVNGSNLMAENFSVALGYTVSGTVTYSGAQGSGQIYLLLNSNCGSYGAQGTSIAYPFNNGGTYTINGVPPGSYTLQAWMDNSANVIPGGSTSGIPSGVSNGIPNVVNPTGSNSGVSITSDLISNAAVTLTDPTVPTVSNTTSGPSLNVISPTDQGVVINFSPVTNTSSVEAVTAYQVQWSSSSSFPTGSSTSSYIYAANGDRGVWILNNSLANFPGTLTNGNAYYFRARGLLAGNKTAWTNYGGTSNPTSVTIGAPSSSSGTNNVYGRVFLPSNVTGQLYVGFYDQGTGSVYADRITSLTSPQSYSLYLPDGDNYIFFTILDQNNNGLIDTGDITNLNSAYSNPLTITGDTGLGDYILAAGNSTAAATTQMTQSTDISNTITTSYGVSLQLLAGVKLPVAVELSAPAVGVSYAYLLAPVDFSACTSCGSLQFAYQPNIASAVPTKKDNFPLLVTYSDTNTETVTASVTGVGATDSNSNTVTAAALQLSGTSTTPNFGWSDPSGASNYRYAFSLSDSSGNVIWQIPSSNAQESTFDSSITNIIWGTDPTGKSSNTPTVSSLTSGAVYTWSIKVVDSNGNSSKTQVSFKP